ncbi:MAG: asparagine synthase (glutamine-hydrolyzing) [Lentisphaeria bacterium]|nr:asparagine synthase (glutamine-hydrolyzing) [Lentisphaeria bacterium]
MEHSGSFTGGKINQEKEKNMCGIAGIINSYDRFSGEETVRAMCGVMRHRGPDGGDIFSAPGAILGHRRLAVIDLESGGQPLYSEDRSLVLVINGEIYNYIQLREKLKRSGHVFATSSDSEVLIHLYEDEGIDFISRLEGMFAFALYDMKKKICILGRDRMGKKPLNWFQHGNELVFASELAALKCHPDFPEELDHDALAEYFSIQYIPQPYSIYRHVHKIAPGHCMVFEAEKNCIRTIPYWKIDFSRKHSGTREEIAAELRRLVEKAVEKRLMSDVPMGVFLSGGIDSNIIAGVTAKLLGKSTCTSFTVGFSDSRYDERKLAAAGAEFINKHSGGKLDYHERTVEIADFSLAAELVRHCGEPYADSSILPTALLSRFAGENITVALSGDGADELFGGYERYLAMTMAGKLDRIPLPIRSLLLRCTNIVKDGGERSFTGRLRRFLRISCAAGSHRYFDLLDRCPEQMRQALFTPEFRSCLSYSGAEYFSSSAGVLSAVHEIEKLSETDILTYLPGDILPKVDISSMAFSLEVRAPFLDREVVEFAAMIPWEMKLHGRERKSILKYAFRDLLAPEISHAPKKGFGVPVAALLRSKWRTPAEELIFESTIGHSEFLNRETVHKLWQDHQNRKADNSYILWSIIGFALFLGEKKCCL